ncbi:NAD-dependent succinate-semialdehyde dehydrogenase [Paraburkholderia sp. Cy-641]|uniref:NAD-dependent succinate-semialdehyde dehydrogenase n=1 Tax=Paraburkholderia sp. Cy-641 TaxID=2608337 RepID=UPI0014200691|nr:NAD-dependent succinate-semialdehyde dehydrogenase [Paraburkholderia sp. Cy-641]NIF78750.1 NAD-dependent succinate-semialdehyde dehydrogenase [Paraburkholderia sp. Cy-641]
MAHSFTRPQLADPSLIRSAAWIDGEWLEAPDGATITVANKATGEPIATVPLLGREATAKAVAAAQAALPAWRRRSAKERAGILRKWFDLVMAHQEDLARIMTAEQGKPLTESRGEIAYAASFIEWFAEQGKRIEGDMLESPNAAQRIMVLKQPIGVCAAITPWNFPAAMITRKAAPALAAGCTMVLKPASQTPLTALALAELSHRAGVPRGVFSVVTGSAREIGAELCENPIVRKLSFTGSTEIGKVLMAQCASTVKKLSMELGGNAPFVVFDDADLDAAVQGAIASKFRNTGQTCVCTNRFLVQAGVYDAFTAKLKTAIANLRVGDGMAEGTSQGPLIDAAALSKVEEHVADARSKGADIAQGGKRSALGGNFFEPTLLVNTSLDMQIFHEETFGPVAAVLRFSTEEEAVEIANASETGLASYLYTNDMSRFFRMAEALETGMVGVNTGLISNEVGPFGGIKESGFGREGSKYGMDDYLETKYVCVQVA